MTPRELEDRVEFWRALLVAEWRVTLVDHELEPDYGDGPSRAVIKASETADHAELWISPTVVDGALGELDVTIVHELLHLHFESIRRPVDALIEETPKALRDPALELLVNAEERVVERLARVIARLEHPDGIVYGVTRSP